MKSVAVRRTAGGDKKQRRAMKGERLLSRGDHEKRREEKRQFPVFLAIRTCFPIHSQPEVRISIFDFVGSNVILWTKFDVFSGTEINMAFYKEKCVCRQ